MTVRRAINILLDRGLVWTSQGKGTFVRPLNLGEAAFRLEQLSTRWLDDNSVEVRLLQASIVPATTRIAEVLECEAGEPTVLLRRLLLRESRPWLYHGEHVRYDPTKPLVEAQLEINSFEGLFEAARSEGLGSGDLSIRATTVAEEIAGLLQVEPGSAAFCLEHVFYDFDGKPFSWGWFLCPADQLRLSARIGARAGLQPTEAQS
jgi:GntR family transcriptional regulator